MSEETYPMTTAGMIQPGFRIGGYTLRDGYGGASKVQITRPEGDGGDFDAKELENLIAAFVNERF